VNKTLEEATVYGYKRIVIDFLKSVNKNSITIQDIASYLNSKRELSKGRYSNILKSLRVFFRDYLKRPEMIEDFRFPSIEWKPIAAPTKEQLQLFYSKLGPLRDKVLFLLYATSGLRLSEVLQLKLSDIDLSKRLIRPSIESSRTKHRLCSFYNEEAEKLLRDHLNANDFSPDSRLFPINETKLTRMFQRASKKSGVKVTAKTLRQWFASEMALLGVSDAYIDAFQGRIPRSVIARHYLNYSEERLKEIYDKADIRVLS